MSKEITATQQAVYRMKKKLHGLQMSKSSIFIERGYRMKKLETRKAIALAMSAAYILFTAYALVTGKNVPEPFGAVVGPIIGYYFGKSAALDAPKRE